MNRKISFVGGIVVLTVIGGAYFIRSNGKEGSLNPGSSEQQTRPRDNTREQIATPTHSPSAAEERNVATGSSDDKNVKKAKKYLIGDEVSRKEYSSIIKNTNVRLFGKAIKGLGLTPEKQSLLMDYLNERREVYRDHSSVIAEHPGMSEAEYRVSLAQAYATVDKEIEAVFGPEKFPQINDMIMSSGYLSQINERFDPKLSAAGYPLTPEQMIPVAMVMADGYGKIGSAETSPTLLNVDKVTGLTATDRGVLKSLAQVLSAEQLQLFQQGLVEKNAVFLRILREQKGYEPTGRREQVRS